MCSVAGVSLPEGKVSTVKRVLFGPQYMQNHRGQDGTGLAVVHEDGRVEARKALGLVSVAVPPEVRAWPIRCGISHNRYATQGNNVHANLQPQTAECPLGTIYVVSNGDVPFYAGYRAALEERGTVFASTNDGELIAHCIANEYDRVGDMDDAIRLVCRQVLDGAFSAIAMIGETLYVFRDPQGFQPLHIAELPDGGIIVASESVAFDILKCDPSTIREVPAGAVYRIRHGVVTVIEEGHRDTASCVFNKIYFGRPDSLLFGQSASLIRRRIGWNLGFEFPLPVDDSMIVVPVMDSALPMAQGFAEATGLRVEFGLVRSHYVARTFIEDGQGAREEKVKRKHNPDRAIVEGQTCIVVDDSKVRGTTSRQIIAMLRRAGAATIHEANGSPRIHHPCFMGIATPTHGELIANRTTLAELAREIGADSVTHLSMDGLRRSIGPVTELELQRFPWFWKRYLEAPEGSWRHRLYDRLLATNPSNHCFACFDGNYPIRVPVQTE